MRSVLVDPREGSKDLFYPIAQQSCKVLSCHLDFGDIAFGGWGPEDKTLQIGVERKVIGNSSDLISSIREGRLSGHQIIGMTQQYDRVYLLVEGQYRPNHNGMLEVFERGQWRFPRGPSMLYRELDNWLNTQTEMVGTRILKSRGRDESAVMIADLFFHWQKKYEHHRSHLAFAKGPTRLYKPNLRARWAEELAHIGIVKATEVGKHFKTPAAMVNASLQEWENIVGKLTAKKVFKEIHG